MMYGWQKKTVVFALASALAMVATSVSAEEISDEVEGPEAITERAVMAAAADANEGAQAETDEALEEESEADPDQEATDEDAFEEEVEESTEEDDDVWGGVDAALDDVEETEEGAEATIIEKPFAPTFAAGLEAGFFFTDLARFNSYVLGDDHDEFDVRGTYHLDFVAESQMIENLRLSVLGGVLFAAQSDPSLFGWYVGAEPAYVARDDNWEMALGMGVGVGSLGISKEMDNGGTAEMDSSLVLLRPFLEVRRHINDMNAVYGRIGFNQWYPRNIESDEFDVENGPTGRPISTPELETGQLYVAVGTRFGALSGTGEPEEIEVSEEEYEEHLEEQEEEDDEDVDLEEQF